MRRLFLSEDEPSPFSGEDMKESKEIVRKRAIDLVKRMSVEEMCGQLLFDAPSIPRLHIPSYNWWNEGLHGAARSGTATVFPQAIGLAAMFDAPRMREIGDIIAIEQRAKYHAFSAQGDRGIYKGLTVWSPNINIFRDPRWGRGQETYGEDPMLTSTLAVQFVKGLQGDGSVLKTAACAKHFVAHSGPEAERHHFNATVSPKDLEETYLPAFKAVVTEANVNGIMGAYNRINGEPCCAAGLIATKLRKDWGFDGLFISDCWALRDIHEQHHYSKNPTESAALALRGGCDLNCGCTYAYLLEAYHKGLVKKEDIFEACVRAMTTRFELGLFDDDDPYRHIPFSEVDSPEHADAALEAARRSIVLLKNSDGFLPLEGMGTIGVIGPNADSRIALVGNYHGTPSREVTFLEGIRSAFSGRVVYSEGSSLTKDRVERLSESGDRLSEAVAVANMSDCIILCLGLDERVEGEMHDDGNGGIAGDKSDLRLPLAQRKLLASVAGTGKPIVVVLASGGAIDPESDGYPNVKAIFQVWYPGQAGGTALADILFGKVSPSGKLPITFYRADTTLPPFEDYSMKDRTYRYYSGTPLYPFGFGLSYTTFSFDAFHVEWQKGEAVVTAMVENTGNRDGEEVFFVTLQTDREGMPLHPFLAGFTRVALVAGERKGISIVVPYSRFSVVDGNGKRTTAQGKWKLFLGNSVSISGDTLSVEKEFVL
jgi:beta-glucosidase